MEKNHVESYSLGEVGQPDGASEVVLEQVEEPQKSVEVKVVIAIKGDRGFIGVQGPDSDPILETFEGDLETALQMVPELVENAHQQWSASPRYPKCERPPPPPPAAQPSRAQRPTTTRQPTNQPSMF